RKHLPLLLSRGRVRGCGRRGPVRRGRDVHGVVHELGARVGTVPRRVPAPPAQAHRRDLQRRGGGADGVPRHGAGEPGPPPHDPIPGAPASSTLPSRRRHGHRHRLARRQRQPPRHPSTGSPPPPPNQLKTPDDQRTNSKQGAQQLKPIPRAQRREREGWSWRFCKTTLMTRHACQAAEAHVYSPMPQAVSTRSLALARISAPSLLVTSRRMAASMPPLSSAPATSKPTLHTCSTYLAFPIWSPKCGRHSFGIPSQTLSVVEFQPPCVQNPAMAACQSTSSCGA
uniref:Uncharacterized protein n=1 Tax=Triticum urartu TaxID=4572 RepID=A0A8R7P630_TRIUA